MTPRELFDRYLAAIRAGDADGLADLYAEDMVEIGHRGVVRGREARRARNHEWLDGGAPDVRELAFEAADDLIRAEVAFDGQPAHLALVLRDGVVWREAWGFFPEAAGQERAPSPTLRVELEPYVAWEARPVADPRTAGADARMPVMMEIVEAEGPMLAKRAFDLYTRASGGKKTTTAVKAPLAGAAWRLKIQDRLTIGREGATTIEDEDVLRVAGSPPVRVRELGPRSLEEVPLDEVAALMERLAEAGASDLMRAVLDTYGLIRLTARADQYLEEALRLASAPR